MRWKIGGLTLALVLASTSALTVEPKKHVECDSLDACLTDVRELARLDGNYGSSMTPAESALVSRIRGYPGAVDALVSLLEDPDDNVANIAAAALRDAHAIDPKYFPQIVRGLDRGLGWLAPALGRMETDQAAEEAVDRLLVSESAPHNQEAYAVELSGLRAVPFIVAHAACNPTCGKDTHWILGAVLSRMNEDARRTAASGLMDVAESSPEPLVRKVLGMINGLGEPGIVLESRLVVLRDQRPSLQPSVDTALIGIRSPRAGVIFAEQLQKEPDVLTLRDLAETGDAGFAAGNVVQGLLDDGNAEIRVAAARTLGFIGYEPAASALIAKLNDAVDVRLSWAAAESLGRLGVSSAIGPLEQAAASHWYPPVREASQRAVRHILDRTAYEPRFHAHNFPFEFFAYQSIEGEQKPCARFAERELREPKDKKLYVRTAQVALQELAYATTVVSFGPADRPVNEGSNGVIEMTAENMVEHRKTVLQVPDVALRTEHGWLVGGDRGEWGGELVYLGDDGVRQTLLERNVEDIFMYGGRYVATVGLAHLTMNDGEVVALSQTPDGAWHSETWRVLPGAPQMSCLTRQGELLVATSSGDGVVISPDGGMRQAVCKQFYDTTSRDSAVRAAQSAADAAAAAAVEAAAESKGQ